MNGEKYEKVKGQLVDRCQSCLRILRGFRREDTFLCGDLSLTLMQVITLRCSDWAGTFLPVSSGGGVRLRRLS